MAKEKQGFSYEGSKAFFEHLSQNKVVWDKDNGQALLQVANIPAVPTAKEYQLWVVINNQPFSAGVFAVNDPTRDNFFKINELNQSASQGAFAITLEPEGGSPQPTGDMYMVGAM